MSGAQTRFNESEEQGEFDPNTCPLLGFESIVSNVNEDLIKKIEVNMILSVTLTYNSGAEVVGIYYEDKLLGGLVTYSRNLKKCLRENYEYRAIVRSVRHGLIRIYIEYSQ